MNFEDLISHLRDCGYVVSATTYVDMECLVVEASVLDNHFELIHFKVDQFTELPRFYLKDSIKYGVLAHVLTCKETGCGFICVNDHDSVSVNFEQPTLAIEESLNRHLSLIKRAISDQNWNRHELLREFNSNWLAICAKPDRSLVCASSSGVMEKLTIYRPVSGRKYGISARYVGVSESIFDLAEFSYIARSVRSSDRQASNGVGFIVPLSKLEPAPSETDQISQWYLSAIHSLEGADKRTFFNVYAQNRLTEFWIVFNAETPSGKTWFSLYFSKKGKKRTLPVTAEKLLDWNIQAIDVSLFNKELIMPRSGASISLSEKNVLLVGCGSVGSEIAHKIASSGVGKMVLHDPDVFSINNLYRHTLREIWIDSNKSSALACDLGFKYPWLECHWSNQKLLELKNKEWLEQHDLIIVAIGSPTHERLFHDYLITHKVKVTVLYTWLEGYGVGGHAVLDLPISKGCLRCAYVDPNTLGRGLSSNLNFLEDNQPVTINHAGCGQLYLPYNAVSSALTALITSDLAIKYLQGKVSKSSKVSWKGDDEDAKSAELIMTHRYEKFSKSLVIEPLQNQYCDIC